MKRQNHGMTLNRDSQWSVEELQEKRDILHDSSEPEGNGKPRASIARAKVGFASEHYHRAVAELAYDLWEKSGHLQETADRNWYKAEAVLKPLWSADLSYASMDPLSDHPAL